MSLVVGVDPGGITGLASCKFPSGTGSNVRRFDAAELPTMEAVHWVDMLLEHLTKHDAATLVVESYTVTSNTVRHARQYDALEVIGAMKYLAWLWTREGKTVNLIMQQPVARKVVSNDALKQLEMYNPSKDKHMIDAAKHLVVASVKLHFIKPEEMVVNVRK